MIIYTVANADQLLHVSTPPERTAIVLSPPPVATCVRYCDEIGKSSINP